MKFTRYLVIRIIKPHTFFNFSRKIWLAISIISGVVSLNIIIYYILKYPDIVIYGEQFIMDEWSPLMFIQFKPITLIFLFTFICWGSLLQFIKIELSKINKNWIDFAILISFLVFLASLYELFFNFALWGALMTITNVENPDILYNKFPNPDTPVSLVYATKIVILIFSISVYSVYFLHNIRSGRTQKNGK
ncbi:hypothetical protein AC481_05295 [miscellaneous Crenarchaeota group archaeon SMTZ-80]|nr:MAG: hypothetical protein AC481_05295 [miscellaneous Crenarchaeota group archaeon SMTZ-80]